MKLFGRNHLSLADVVCSKKMWRAPRGTKRKVVIKIQKAMSFIEVVVIFLSMDITFFT